MSHNEKWIELDFLYLLGKKETEGEVKKNLHFEKNIVHIIISQFVI